MPDRSSARPASPSALPNLHAGVEATEGFANRHRALSSGFFRPTTFGVLVSSIGIGTYLGESTDAEDKAYESSVRHAVRSGVNLIDTAINYRSQRSERSVGAAIEGAIVAGEATRSELVVCSKAGYIPFDGIPPASRQEYQDYVREQFFGTQILHPDDVVAGGHSLASRFLKYCIAKSRQNLGLRTIDVYYLHNPGQQLSGVSADEFRLRLRAAFATLEEAVARGEIGVYGCATWDELRLPPDARGHVSLADLLAIARDVAGESHHFRVVQMPINLAMTEAVRVPTQPLDGALVPALSAATALGLTVVASASLMQSKLTSGLPAALSDAFPECTTDAQRALSFVRSLPGVTSALVGMRREAHVDENVASAPNVASAA
jgi:aryl-alcohol dehydrogenase-like predicted oxidoreductase